MYDIITCRFYLQRQVLADPILITTQSFISNAYKSLERNGFPREWGKIYLTKQLATI